MSTARQHVQSNISSSFVNYELPMWRSSIEEDEFHCVYCGCSTDDYYDPDYWDLSFEDFAAVHEVVSSSRFRRGAIRAARRSTEGIIPIELVDANSFFDMLGVAQL